MNNLQLNLLQKTSRNANIFKIIFFEHFKHLNIKIFIWNYSKFIQLAFHIVFF